MSHDTAFEARLNELHAFERFIQNKPDSGALEFVSDDLNRLRDTWLDGDHDAARTEFAKIVDAFAVPSLATRREQITELSGLFGEVESRIHGDDLNDAELSRKFELAWKVVSFGDLRQCVDTLFEIAKHSETNQPWALKTFSELEPFINFLAESLIWSFPVILLPGRQSVERSFQIDSLQTVLMQLRCYAFERRICELIVTRDRSACCELLSMAATYLERCRQIVKAHDMMSAFVEFEYVVESASDLPFDEFSLELKKLARKVKLLTCEEMNRLDRQSNAALQQNALEPQSVEGAHDIPTISQIIEEHDLDDDHEAIMRELGKTAVDRTYQKRKVILEEAAISPSQFKRKIQDLLVKGLVERHPKTDGYYRAASAFLL